jgi:hypothetical protein
MESGSSDLPGAGPFSSKKNGSSIVFEHITRMIFIILIVVKTDFSAKGPHFSSKRKIFPLTVKDAERALFARIQLGRS